MPHSRSHTDLIDRAKDLENSLRHESSVYAYELQDVASATWNDYADRVRDLLSLVRQQDQQLSNVSRLREQAISISLMLGGAGCNACPIEEGVRNVIQRAQAAEARLSQQDQEQRRRLHPEIQQHVDEIVDSIVSCADEADGGKVDARAYCQQLIDALRVEQDQEQGRLRDEIRILRAGTQ